MIDIDDDGDIHNDDDDDIDDDVVVELSNNTDFSQFKTSCTIGRSKGMIDSDGLLLYPMDGMIMTMTMTATTTASQ